MPSCLALLLAAAAVAVTAPADGASLQPAVQLVAAAGADSGEGLGCSPFVHVDLYGEALCPFTMEFITKQIAPLLPDSPFERIIKFRYIAWGNALWNSTQGGMEPACQHGPDECRLNRVINCAQRLRPAQAQWLPFVSCLASKSRKKALGSVDMCAEGTAIEADALWRCVDGPDGDALESKAAEVTAALDPPHTYVPWVVVNGIPLGGLDSQLTRIVCIAFSGIKPKACYEPPPDAAAAAALSAGGHTSAAAPAGVA
ncbi:hypothetical protein ABPG75_009001 [Micractinium tetrahymenae]